MAYKASGAQTVPNVMNGMMCLPLPNTFQRNQVSFIRVFMEYICMHLTGLRMYSKLRRGII